jgi:hypothetical protein
MLKRCEKYQEGLKQIPAPGKGCHPFLLAVANRGVRAGLEDAVIVEDIEQNIPQGRREVPRREIEQAVEQARADFEKPRGLRRPGGAGVRVALTARLVGRTTAKFWMSCGRCHRWPCRKNRRRSST